ncbi:hypothetical protein [Terrisporobacter sp.]|uniref:hypothetical protein n=1 Tax=Terrisporobacter sp. TaxID=1965305 RepID=UPI00289771E9|nr:hypothetical protein [Terrisporobacter sp.]
MFKFKIGEIVLYDKQNCKIMNRLYKECKLIKGGSEAEIHYDLSTMNGEILKLYVSESDLKACPNYTVTIEDKYGEKSVYYVNDIIDTKLSKMSFTQDKIMISDIEVDKIYGIKLH